MKLKLNKLLVSNDVSDSFPVEAYILMVWSRGLVVLFTLLLLFRAQKHTADSLQYRS